MIHKLEASLDSKRKSFRVFAQPVPVYENWSQGAMRLKEEQIDP
jgi:hypothetical protein